MESYSDKKMFRIVETGFFPEKCYDRIHNNISSRRWKRRAGGETVTITREPLAAQSIFDTGSRLQRQKAQAALFGSMREYVYYPGSFSAAGAADAGSGQEGELALSL